MSHIYFVHGVLLTVSEVWIFEGHLLIVGCEAPDKYTCIGAGDLQFIGSAMLSS
jgi:hypothetical protein